MHLSIADGLGIGLGFTMSLTFLGAVREILGTGAVFGVPVMWEGFQPFTVMTEAPGAFLCLGLILGLMNWNTRHQARKRNLAVPENPLPGCGGCTACGAGRQGE